MKRMLIIALAALFAATGLQAQDLVILHTNDTHSQIEPIRVGRNKGLGGVERRLQYIDSIRAKYGKRKVLLLDAGDFNQGTPYYTVAHGDLEVELVNLMAREQILKRAFEKIQDQYDYVLIDCPPAFTASSVAALRAADQVVILIPLQGGSNLYRCIIYRYLHSFRCACVFKLLII